MDLSALSSNSNNSIFELFKQRRDGIKAMEAAVQSGDIATAQQNLATVQQDTQSIQSATGLSNGQQNPYQITFKTDLSNLMNAVQGGDIATAQAALQKLQQDSQTSTAAPSSDATTSTSNQTSSPFLNDLTNLLNSVLSGDASGVQSAATALEQDVKAAFGTATTASADQTATTQASSSQSGTTQASATPTTSTSTTSGPSQSSFLTDLQSLITAANSNDTAGIQSAAKNLAQDIQNAVEGTTSGQISGHHHHHHHSAGTANAASTGATTTTANSSAGAPAQGNDGDSDDQGKAQTTGQTSGAGTNSALKNAQDAYQLLMSFSQQTTTAAA